MHRPKATQVSDPQQQQQARVSISTVTETRSDLVGRNMKHLSSAPSLTKSQSQLAQHLSSPGMAQCDSSYGRAAHTGRVCPHRHLAGLLKRRGTWGFTSLPAGTGYLC
jgi:hypothetical protein